MARSGKSATASTAIGVGCLALFSLPFAAGGTYVLWLAAKHAWESLAAQSWMETPAQLRAAKLVVKHGDGSTFKATATYEYTVAGQRYQSERVSFSPGSDNIGTFQADKGRELEGLLAAGGKTVCFVDPDDPRQAVLYRDSRPLLLAMETAFASVFCLVGYGLLGAAWYGGRKARADNARKSAHPHQPWLWREDWAVGRVRSQTKGAAIAVAIFALIWNLMSWPAIVAVLFDRGREWWLPLVVAIFPLVGTGLAAWAIHLWRVVWRWGTSEFELASVPGVLGGPVAGVIHGPPAIDAADGFRIRLACIRKVTTGSGDDRTTEERELWSEERRLARPLSADAVETAIPVQFHAPFHLPATNADDDVLWRLTVNAATAGPDYQAQFKIPVFETAASSDQPPPATADDPLAGLELPPTIDGVVKDAGGRVEYDAPDELTLYFPMTRNWGLKLVLAVAAIIWTGVCVVLYFSDAPRFFFYVFTFFDLFILPTALVTPFRSLRLTVRPGRLVVDRRWMGFGNPREYSVSDPATIKTRGTPPKRTLSVKLRRGEVTAKVEPSPARQTLSDADARQITALRPVDSGTRVNNRVYPSLQLETVGGKPLILVPDISSSATAQHLADAIVARLGG